MYPTKVSIKDFLDGQETKNKDKYCKCRYKVNGKWIRAGICFSSGAIKVGGQVIRRCVV